LAAFVDFVVLWWILIFSHVDLVDFVDFDNDNSSGRSAIYR